MIARPETAAWAGSPRCARPEASAAAAPPTQKTSAKAAIASAATRRERPGRSGKDALQRDSDDLQASGEAAERGLPQVVLRHAEHRRCVAVAGQLQRLGDVRQQVTERLTDGVGLVGVVANGLA